MFKRSLLYIFCTLSINLGIIFAGQQAEQQAQLEVATPLPTGHFSDDSATIKRVGEDQWVLVEDFYFTDSLGHVWYAPAGTSTDGASIPQAFLSVIGDKFHPDYLDAAVVHDAYCDTNNASGPSFQTETWEYVHYMFYEALLTNGVPEEKAKIMYTAVYLGGPRWGDEPALSGTATSRQLVIEENEHEAELQLRELALMADWIEEENPDFEEIQSRLSQNGQD